MSRRGGPPRPVAALAEEALAPVGAAPDGTVRVIFLGGLGEVGRNCCAIEVNGRLMLVDVGLMFPDSDMPGIDLVLPDFTYLRRNSR